MATFHDNEPFDKVSRQLTFIHLIGIIHRCIMNDPDLFKRDTTQHEYVGPMQVLADHLENEGFHDAANNVRMILEIGAANVYATSWTVEQERVRDRVRERMAPVMSAFWKLGPVKLNLSAVIVEPKKKKKK